MKNVNVQKILGKSLVWIKKNSATILTFAGAAGVIATVITAVKATPKAMLLIEAAKEEKGEELTKFEMVKSAAVAYIQPAVLCVTSLACIFGASMLSQRQQAALVSAYALIDKSYKDYRKKIDDVYGNGANVHIKDEIAKDKYAANKIVKSNKDTILFYDDFSGRYFEADEKTVIEAEYKINKAIMTECYATIAYFYKLIGLDVDNEAYEYIGWTCESALDWMGYCWLDFSHHTVIMDDGLEATIIYPFISPSIDYMDDYIDIPDAYKTDVEYCNLNATVTVEAC